MDQLSIPQERPVYVHEDKLRRREEAAVRRSTRYTQAEQAVADSFRLSQQELPTSQLQIHTLKRTISLLNARISDADEAVQKLRTLLADRTIEPREYQTLQHQRWLHEKRLLAAEELSKVLQQCLSMGPLSLAQTQTLPRRSSNAKSNSNLANFLEFSLHRISTRRQPHRNREVKTDRMSSLSRIHRHDTLLPLLLPLQRRRPLQTTPTVTLVQKTWHTAETSPTPPSPNRLYLSEPYLTTDLASPAPPPMSISGASISTPSLHSTDVTGTATIWRETVELSEEEILKNLVVSIPDYVNDLLAEFDSIFPTGYPELRNPDNPSENLTSRLPRATFSLDNFTSSCSENTSSTDSSTFPTHKFKQRQSMLSSLPDSLSSRMGIKSTDNRSIGRTTWRFSSPPSSFPAANLPRESVTISEPVPSPIPRRPSFSISDLRSAFTLSASDPADSTPPKPDLSSNFSQQAKADEKFFTRLRRRMSTLRRF